MAWPRWNRPSERFSETTSPICNCNSSLTCHCLEYEQTLNTTHIGFVMHINTSDSPVEKSTDHCELMQIMSISVVLILSKLHIYSINSFKNAKAGHYAMRNAWNTFCHTFAHQSARLLTKCGVYFVVSVSILFLFHIVLYNAYIYERWVETRHYVICVE